MNPKSFQIISAGQDDIYGANDTNKIFPTGDNYGDQNGPTTSSGDFDNLTNFTTKRLEEAFP
jgi:hypothetical protein